MARLDTFDGFRPCRGTRSSTGTRVQADGGHHGDTHALLDRYLADEGHQPPHRFTGPLRQVHLEGGAVTLRLHGREAGDPGSQPAGRVLPGCGGDIGEDPLADLAQPVPHRRGGVGDLRAGSGVQTDHNGGTVLDAEGSRIEVGRRQ